MKPSCLFAHVVFALAAPLATTTHASEPKACFRAAGIYQNRDTNSLADLPEWKLKHGEQLSTAGWALMCHNGTFVHRAPTDDDGCSVLQVVRGFQGGMTSTTTFSGAKCVHPGTITSTYQLVVPG